MSEDIKIGNLTDLNIANNNQINYYDLVAEVEKSKKENNQLKEALKKCEYDYEGYCNFCSVQMGHADDCEYRRLIGGDGE